MITMNTQVRRVILLIVALCGVAKETSLLGSSWFLFLKTTTSRNNHLRALSYMEGIDMTLDRLVPHSTSRGPNQDVAICACAKCGSTALYQELYPMIFDEPWRDPHGGCVQQVHLEQWRHAFNTTELSSIDELVDYFHKPSTFTYAVIRDPKERLISAWKSKITCSTSWNTDTYDRERLVRSILKLANLPLDKKECLSLSEYLRVLVKIHQDGNAHKLDRHFLPQTENCFKYFSPSEWDVVTTVGAPMASEKLWNALQMKPTTTAHKLQNPFPQDFPVKHATGQSSDLQLSSKDEEMLEYLTKHEYQVFGDFLPSNNNNKNDKHHQATESKNDGEHEIPPPPMKDNTIIHNISKVKD